MTDNDTILFKIDTITNNTTQQILSENSTEKFLFASSNELPSTTTEKTIDKDSCNLVIFFIQFELS